MSMDRCNCGRMVDTDFDLSFYDTDPPSCEHCQEALIDEMRAQWEAEFISEQALPAHKQQGYAEFVTEQADLKRKESRENK